MTATMTWPELPIWIVDLIGSALMIYLSFLCVHRTGKLRSMDRENAVWTYLLWFGYGLAAFSISRAVGHIAKRLLLLSGHPNLWAELRPFSGAINTAMFMVVASITLFFERIWKIYEQIMKDRQDLHDTEQKLLDTNRYLEDRVAERSRELLWSEGRYRSIFEASLDLILVADRNGMIVDINPAGKRMLGIAEEPLPEKSICLADYFGDREDWRKLLQKLDTQGYEDGAELDWLGPGNRHLSVLLTATAQQSPENREPRYHFLVKDISQRKLIHQQLLQADKLASIGQLAAGIAHEVNNPLSIILGYTQLLIRSEEPDTERYQDLRTIEKHTRSCKTIVEDLLNFSRSTRTRKETSSLHEAIEGILNVVRHHFQLDNVELECRFDPDVPPMVLDKEKIGQVFMNLVMNAKQAIGDDGKVVVSTRYDPEQQAVTVQVRDTGCGIDAQSLPRIFDPFFTTKKTGEGTGLGLSVSYGIVQHHNGNILVQSKPGEGTTFSVILPVATETTSTAT